MAATDAGRDTPQGLLERVVKARRHRPVFIVDLAVPRDVEREAAELNDVRDFFKTYYAPNNASVAIVGDYDPKTIKALDASGRSLEALLSAYRVGARVDGCLGSGHRWSDSAVLALASGARRTRPR